MNASPESPHPVEITLPGRDGAVSGLLVAPPEPLACLVLAHGAGAGMTHPFLATVSTELSGRRVATLRYQFPYMERGARRPDPPAVARATVRSAVDEAARLLPQVPLFAGGKSFGGRMTSETQAAAALPGVRGLVFLGFPLHPSGKPSDARAAHLHDVRVPMLFLQGTRDTLADLGLMRAVVGRLGTIATLEVEPAADHSFHVPRRSGRTDGEVLAEVSGRIEGWMRRVLGGMAQSAVVRARGMAKR